MSNITDEVLDEITPSKLGKLFMAAMSFVFAAAVMLTVSERDHAEFKASDARQASEIKANSSAFIAISSQLATLSAEVYRDRDYSEERRVQAAGDRARIQRMLEQLLDRAR